MATLERQKPSQNLDMKWHAKDAFYTFKSYKVVEDERCCWLISLLAKQAMS